MLNILLALAYVNTAIAQYQASEQLLEYLETHQEPPGILTTQSGYPVAYAEANLGINAGSSLLLNTHIYESLSSVSNAKIPPRLLNPNGNGAKGVFKVTHDVSKITNVNHFNIVGKETPVIVRFSTLTGEKESSEIRERVKGFAIKFYTKKGIMDLLGLTTDAFMIKDPVYNTGFVHAIKTNPKTSLRDPAMLLDFVYNRPEGLLFLTQMLSPIGQPRGYRFIAGHAIHTYQVENDKGDISFVRFNWYPDAGVQSFTNEEVITLQRNPDYMSRDLYDSIANKTYPSWTLFMQVVPKDEVAKAEFDIFDVTLNWPEENYPNVPVGTLVLDNHVDNYYAELEQAAFNPGNLPPGIRGMDKLFESRIFNYRDSQIHRLGTGFNRIPVNCPINEVHTYTRDGNPPVSTNGGDSPTYYKNSFNGFVPENRTLTPLYRPLTVSEATNHWQVSKFYRSLSDSDKETLVENAAAFISAATRPVQDKLLNLYRKVDSCLAGRLEAAVVRC